MTATAAEVTKTAENTFRDLQISAANQLALYCEAMGINFYDVRAGIDSLKGEGITRAILWPGAGVGGHCLTKDTYHLERGIKVAGIEPLDYPEGKESLYVLARAYQRLYAGAYVQSCCERIETGRKGGKWGKDCHARLVVPVQTPMMPGIPLLSLSGISVIQAGASVQVHDPWVKEYPGVILSSDLEKNSEWC